MRRTKFGLLALLATGMTFALLSAPSYADDEVEQFKVGFVKGCQSSVEEKAVSQGHEVKAEHKAKITKLCTCVADGVANEVPSSEWLSLLNAPESNPTVARISEGCLAQLTQN